MTDIKDLVLQEKEKGNVVISTIEGLQTIPVDEFVNQPIDGILYDLNRDQATVLTLIKDPKWINDFAVSVVITHLKEQNDELEQLFDLQHKRTVKADKLWRKAHPGNENVLPDLGRLIDWLLKESGKVKNVSRKRSH